ncbi:YdgH/BhsA/McbA-like domain containing protein [Scandinavium manionii]|uniref:YdgH/BhsA/McbA-like domain containing protein n=1 Tax=Scandinavium manionii TaxID=2926520 RepID=UPI0013597312|nr:YdgH/BhsA/McbA-like domain containing protein [Scandinavium manionii]MCS2164037.1 DUF1471 domain-containing protein [Scandinavium manionii]
MKTLIRDVIAIFTRQPRGPVILKDDLTEEEKANLAPVRSFSLGWITSVEELECEVARQAREAGAAGYLISDFEQGRFIHARATLFA